MYIQLNNNIAYVVYYCGLDILFINTAILKVTDFLFLFMYTWHCFNCSKGSIQLGLAKVHSSFLMHQPLSQFSYG